MPDYTNFPLPQNGLQSAYGGTLPDAVQRFINCAISMVTYNENIAFDALPPAYQQLVYGDKFLDQPNSIEYKDIVCADLITVAYTYALGHAPTDVWWGCDPVKYDPNDPPDPNRFTTHLAANFYRPCGRNASHLQPISDTLPELSPNEDWQPGDLIVFGNIGSNPIAQHVVAYVGPVNWLNNGQIVNMGQSIVNASINTDENGGFVNGSDAIWLFRLVHALTIHPYYPYNWAQHVRITDLWS